MKILDLHLRAFGPFTDRHLDLSGGRHGLHLIFGPNEAGKSSALRALRALLYGIPERTQDDFLHANKDLRVGGRLRGADGAELVVFRRKGRKNTLLGGDDKAIDDETLTRLLAGVDEPLFKNLFGIDHEGLVTGGQTLLAERGREAEALFGSGLGSVDLPAVLKRLDQEADELFRSGGSKPLINSLLSQRAEIAGRQRDASLSAHAWDEARKSVDRTKAKLAELRSEVTQAERQRSRLERIRRTLPTLARRAQLREQLAPLGEVPALSEGFGQRREAAVSRRTLALAAQSGAQARTADLQAKAAALKVSQDLLAEAEAIDDLRERLGSHRKADQDRPALLAQRTALDGQAAALLAQVRPDLSLAMAPGLRPLLNRRRRTTELGGRREAVAAAVEQARVKLAETGHKLAGKRQALAALPPSAPPDALRRAVDEARRAGDLDRSIADAQTQIQRHADDCARDLSALGRWGGDLAALRRAPLPGAETIERCAADAQALDEAQRALDRDQAEAQTERLRIAESLRALQLAGAVPSEDDLGQTRTHRDLGWRLLKRQWVQGEDVGAEAQGYAGDTPLPSAYETAVTAADEIADRLRREAQRVHDQASTQARLEACEQRLSTVAQASAALTERRAVLDHGWRSSWSACEITPLPPREMLHWLAKAERLRERAGQGDTLVAGLADLQETRTTHVRALTAALSAVGSAVTVPPREGFAGLLNQAEVRLASLLETERRRDGLGQEIAELVQTERALTLEVETREADRSDWSTAWGALMEQLGFPLDASPGEVADHLKTLDDCLKQIDEAQRLAERINGIDTDALEFRQRADGLLERLAPDLLGRPIEDAVLQLHARLGRQREDQSRRDELTQQSRQAQAEVERAQTAIREAEAILTELCREAGCESPEQLPAVEQRASEHRLLRRQLTEVEAELVNAGDGLGIDALQGEAGSVDRDAVMSELSALAARIDGELRPQEARLLEEKLSAERDFAAMAGDDTAAALAEEAQQTTASLRNQAERYVRVKLAARILRDEIERFRRQHRDPILTRASGYFAQLTCNAFSAVETDFDESDQPVLVGLRATGERLRVEGMSTGTRDQLYLALRLASLDHYLDGADPLPFIVDDILIQFDDARAQATLKALADFSAKTQVILFTHHRQVVEQARSLDPSGERVLIHRLTAGP